MELPRPQLLTLGPVGMKFPAQAFRRMHSNFGMSLSSFLALAEVFQTFASVCLSMGTINRHMEMTPLYPRLGSVWFSMAGSIAGQWLLQCQGPGDHGVCGHRGNAGVEALPVGSPASLLLLSGGPQVGLFVIVLDRRFKVCLPTLPKALPVGEQGLISSSSRLASGGV